MVCANAQWLLGSNGHHDLELFLRTHLAVRDTEPLDMGVLLLLLLLTLYVVVALIWLYTGCRQDLGLDSSCCPAAATSEMISVCLCICVYVYVWLWC
jgi:hypothetical protein